MVLLETDESEVEQMINYLRADCTSGIDGVSTGVLKKYKDILSRPITFLVNLCLSTVVFPYILKKGLVHPIHKSGDRDHFNKYRPISILPALSIIFKKLLTSVLKIS